MLTVSGAQGNGPFPCGMQTGGDGTACSRVEEVEVSDLRMIGDGFDPEIVRAIDARLDEAEAAHGVHILLAIESGSRGWGFPSPDSDYDCRFLYVRPRDDYISLYPPRDVIEYAPDGIHDVNGWDLAKALRLLLKGNAVVIEWLTSPWAYRGDAGFRKAMLDLADRVVRPEAIARHYWHLGQQQYHRSLEGLEIVPLKKVFYTLRPAVALRWMRLHPGRGVLPMAFPDLPDAAEIPVSVRSPIADLLAAKAVTRELGEGPLPASVRELIIEEFERAGESVTTRLPAPEPEAIREADRLFRAWIDNASLGM